MPERLDATTLQEQETTTSKSAELSTTDATTKSTISSTTTSSDTTTSQDTITSKTAEVSTTDATSKSTTSPSTTMPDTTTSHETPASTCSSPPVDCEFGGSFYNFSTCWVNHSSAVSACSQYGSHLVFIESQEEEDFIAGRVQYLSDRNITYFWIGLTGLSPSEASRTYRGLRSGRDDALQANPLLSSLNAPVRLL
ncbi:A-agglutinin anchorage subunit-like [Strongylocentrotus purpuratus]|uniref:C-type lectin domain-containing protein n=1 Tax=Strongylocentrotus purpuratus TaxID=7668 RepID=A0A7M7NP24_STRPU|nr:A-agglutinin anchorage subunit-like [Strongylocentrotus purpuratus]